MLLVDHTLDFKISISQFVVRNRRNDLSDKQKQSSMLSFIFETVAPVICPVYRWTFMDFLSSKQILRFDPEYLLG